MKQRQYVKEILGSVNDLHRAQSFVDLYRNDGFDMNRRLGLLGRTMVNKAARIKADPEAKEQLISLLMRSGADIYLSPRFEKENTYQLILRKFGPHSDIAKRFKRTHQFVMDLSEL